MMSGEQTIVFLQQYEKHQQQPKLLTNNKRRRRNVSADIWTDASFDENIFVCASAIHFECKQRRQKINLTFYHKDIRNSNEAEAVGIIQALRMGMNRNIQALRIFTDSKSCCNTFNNICLFKRKCPRFLSEKVFNEINQLISRFRIVTFHWCARSSHPNNVLVDRMARFTFQNLKRRNK